MHKNNNKLRYSIRKYENLSCLQLNIGIHKRRIYLLKESNKLYQSTLIDVFGPLPATMGDRLNRPEMTTKPR